MSGFDEGLSGTLAPPMANGEVVFEAPWQSRVFGMARALSEAGAYSWDEFRAHLIAQIDRWDRSGSTDDYAYFDHFLAAFEALLADKGLLGSVELDDRERVLAARPVGHDHPHEH
ncbi:MAG: nitrile hydratase accessory protein [Pseudomonadota bacterium]